ncbi:MAG: hypothetical protein RLZ56_363 [Bacteroidota bacterium]|jgi:lycopene beta-cyclase
MDNKGYDIIIAGAGCAGLSLLYALLNHPTLKSQSILVVDQSFEKSNDRTWCYWEEQPGVFDSLVVKSWEAISVHKGSMNRVLTTAPFTYKMLQGVDFYNHVMDFAKGFFNVHWVTAKINSIDTEGDKGIVQWEGGEAIAKSVFSSVLPLDQLYTVSQQAQKETFLWQHFKGQLIQFEEAILDDDVAKLMDFNVQQKGATGFMYVLPLDKQTALVEYTLFSSNLLTDSAYQAEIDFYLQIHYPQKAFSVLHEERGAIPMTTQALAKSIAPIYVIGTLGNAVKASTGYAFRFIQQQVTQIVTALAANKTAPTEVHQGRHAFYDAVLLYILKRNLMEGSEIFARIFAKNKAATIFKFLSNSSDIWEDIKIMRSLPTRIFLPAAIKVLLRRN